MTKVFQRSSKKIAFAYKIFLPLVLFGAFSAVTTIPTVESQSWSYDEIYVDARGIVPGVVRLPPRSIRIVESRKCDKKALKSVKSLVPKGVKCVGQVIHDGVIYLIYPNWMRNQTNSGTMRIVVSGLNPQVLPDVAAVESGFLGAIIVDDQYLEFISVAPQDKYDERKGHPFLRYRIVGTSGSRQIQLIPAKMFAKGKTPIDLNRKYLAGSSVAKSSPKPSSTPKTTTSNKSTRRNQAQSPADVFLERNPELDRTPSDRSCGSVRQDGVVVNLADFFDCDQGAAIRMLNSGKKILFTPNKVSFANGQFVGSSTQKPAKVEAAQIRLEERERGQRNNSGYMDDFGIVTRAQPLYITCNFGSKQIDKGVTLISYVKLKSFSGRSVVLNCQ